MNLPAITACFNLLATILLVSGFIAIRKGNTQRHAKLMGAAFVASTFFLASYLTHHFTAPELSVKYAGPDAWRTPYLGLLLTHTVLAAVVPFLVIRTMLLGRCALAGDTVAKDKHRRLAKYTFPIWLFVSISGVVIYLVLYHLTNSWELAQQSLQK